MLKLIGSILVILGTAAFGYEMGNDLQRHLYALEELRKLLVLLRSELLYTKAPFAELFFEVSRKTEGVYREWLRRLSADLAGYEKGTFQEVWEASVCEDLKESGLTKAEREDLCKAGGILGFPKSLELYIEQLDFAIQKTREEVKGKKKLYFSMGIMSGIFLVIVLL